MAELEQAIAEIWCGECEHKGKCEDAPYGGGLLGIDCKMKRDAFTALLTPCWQTARDEGYKVGFETGKAEGAILEKMHVKDSLRIGCEWSKCPKCIPYIEPPPACPEQRKYIFINE